jgi:hypothetical protein
MSQLLTASDSGHLAPAELEEGDALIGGVRIWQYHNQLLGTDLSLGAVFKRLKLGQLPAQKIAGSWVASKRGLRRFYGRNTGLAA